jgi:ABC-type Fe3+/spermidine/putrescine transport system ATPase subunit
MPKKLQLESVTKEFNRLAAVKNVNLEIGEGEFVTLLGPSGCGKTTTLRMIAGFETPTSGRIRYDGRVINDLIPQRRNFGIVFQSYALFPHMRVKDNVAFGMKMHRYPKQRIRQRVDELLHLVGLAEHREKYPPELSGGMQQRVALARALAPSPEVILLDEPLSALDAKIRVKLRAEIKQLQTDLGITTIYVTHDQEEALSISDRVVVMNRGEIEQIDRPLDIYKNPTSRYVADFVGTSNFFEGELEGNLLSGEDFRFEVFPPPGKLSGPATAAIRPEKIEILATPDAPAPAARRNLLDGYLVVVTFLGLMVRLVVRAGQRELIVDYLEKRYEESGLQRGDGLRLYLPPEAFRVYPR